MLETMGSRWPNARRGTRRWLAACKTLAFPSAVRKCGARLDERDSLALHLLYRFHNLSCGASIDPAARTPHY